MNLDLGIALDHCQDQLGWTCWRLMRRLGGNQDRNPSRAIEHALIELESDGATQQFKVTLAADLKGAFQRQKAWHQALPHHSAKPGLLFSTPAGDLWQQPAIEAIPLEEALQDSSRIPSLLIGWDRLANSLAATELPSDQEAWQGEWRKWKDRFRSLPLWRPADKPLVSNLLTELEESLRGTSSVSRWTNGDFTSRNVLVEARGGLTLIDTEHASRSHFFAEDCVRLARLSPFLKDNPAFAEILTGPIERVWSEFFELKQLWLECEQNTETYHQRITLPRRDNLCRRESPDFDAGDPIVRLPARPRDTIQLFVSNTEEWNEDNSQRLPYFTDAPQTAAFRIPAETERVRLDPTAEERPVLLTHLCAVDQSSQCHSLLETAVLHNCRMATVSATTREIQPENSDPQLILPIPPDTAWLWIGLDQAGTSSIVTNLPLP